MQCFKSADQSNSGPLLTRTVLAHIWCIWTFKFFSLFWFFVNKSFAPSKWSSVFRLYFLMCSLPTIVLKIILSTDICYFLFSPDFNRSEFPCFILRACFVVTLLTFVHWRRKKWAHQCSWLTAGCKTSSTTWANCSPLFFVMFFSQLTCYTAGVS